ncbi:Basement membrane-specific heparan sulfate proteoglycan core protein [Merluccius polli]|uniref:B-cell receptor CD22 n=1 Tax=Merluccius polli TaxID=89951 RepID=A0AA47P9X1_MERPO|nr:Basement membrane-specific heparan sulfate proteoglycan core protein [Merluccius polli]
MTCLFFTALQGNDDWGVTYTSSNVCALRGSTVEISCTYRYPKKQDGRYITVQKTLWLTKTDGDEYVDLRRDADYADRVEYSCGENSCTRNIYSCNRKCTLRIRDLRLSDSVAWYKFRFITNQPGGKYTGDPGVTLSVTDLQVKVSFPDPTLPTLADLECHSMCGLAGPYIWTRRGQSVGGGRSYSDYIGSEDIFSCAVEGYEHLPSPPVCKSTPQCTDIMPGSEITPFFFTANMATPSVTVRPSGEIEEGSSVTMSCSSDANPAANYTWFKDNTDNSSRYMNQGQQLVFDRIKSSDSGQYLCESKNELGTKSASISINVKYGPKHTSVISSPSGGVKEGSSVTLSCSSDANPAAKYTWFKEHEDSVIESGQNYTITNITSELGGNYYCQAHNAIRRHNSTFLSISSLPDPVYENISALTNRSSPSVQREPIELQDLLCPIRSETAGPVLCALQGYDDWRVIYTSSNVCALRGSTVEISCSYRYPKKQDGRYNTVQETLWFRDEYVDLRSDTDYADRVEYSCGENSCYWYSCYGKCTLRIRDLRLSDSAAEYKFQFRTNQPGGKYTGDPGVTLSVTDPDLQVKVSFPDPTQPTLADLECHSMCGLAGPYNWTRSGQSVGGGRSYRVYIRSEDIFSCAVEGYEHLPSPPVYAPETPSVTVRPSGEIEEGSSVTLSCSSDANPAANYTWFKDNTDNSSRYMNQGQQLVFDRIKSSDSGKYLCEAKNEFGTKSASISINVKYGPKHTSVISSPSGGVKEGSSVTLSCSSDANPAAKYTWFKNNQTLLWKPIQRYTFTSVRSEDRGKYCCQAENKYGRLSSNWVFIDVQYGPKHTSVISSPSGGVKEGSSVTLSCSSDANPAANYTWFKDNTDNSSRDMNQGQQLVFGHIKSSDSGKYLCEAKNEFWTKSASISINVKYGPKHTSVISSPSGGVKEGSSVTLSCSSDANPAAKYTWFKNNQTLLWKPIQRYTFTSVRSEDRGKYCCQAENKYGRLSSNWVFIDVQYGPKHTSVISSPSGGVKEGSSVTLSCSSDANPAANYTWFKDNTDNSSRDMNQGQQLVFGHIKSSDSGKYLCEAKNEFGTKSASISINVKYGPKHTSVISSPSGGVKEGSSVTLSCSSDANPAAKYTWFKNNQPLLWKPIQRYTFTSVHSEDSGTYRCQAVNKYGRLSSNLVFIDVQYGPKHTSVISSPSGGVKEGSSVTLSCSSDANPAANYTWFKDNTDNSSRYMNQGQQLVFGHIKSSDSGQYLCKAQNELRTKSASISMNVKYGPKHTSVISSPSGGVKEGSSVTLSCSSDANPAANYTWFKEHEDSVIESGQNYTITNITSELGGNYYCQAHNAIGRHNSTFLSISVTDIITDNSSCCENHCCCFVGHHTPPPPLPLDESLPDPVYENISALTNSSSPSVQREPIELQDLLCPIRSETAGPVLCGQL